MEINQLVRLSHDYAKNKGFWNDQNTEDKRVIATKLMLIVTEVAEAMEAIRKEGFGNLGEELADVVIRVADLSGALGIDLGGEIETKALRNSIRPYMHGKVL